MIHVPAASEYSLLITGSINLDLTTYVGITYKEWCSQFGDTSSKTYCSAPEPSEGSKIGHGDNSICSALHLRRSQLWLEYIILARHT